MDGQILNQIALNMRNATLVHFSPKGMSGQLFLGIESETPAAVIEEATMKGVRGASIEDTGLATYVYWKHLPCQASSDKQLEFTLRSSDLSDGSSPTSG